MKQSTVVQVSGSCLMPTNRYSCSLMMCA